MTIAFHQVIDGWAGTAPAVSDPFTPNAAGDALIFFASTNDGIDQALTFSGTGTFTQAITYNTAGSQTVAASYNLSAASGSQTVSLTDVSAGFVQTVIGLDYSGVASVTSPVVTDNASPGTGTGAIVGQAVVVPSGSVLVAYAVDVSFTGGVTITNTAGTSRSSSPFTICYNVTEYAGTGGSITPAFTASALGTDDYVVIQFLLNPNSSSVFTLSANSLSYGYSVQNAGLLTINAANVFYLYANSLTYSYVMAPAVSAFGLEPSAISYSLTEGAMNFGPVSLFTLNAGSFSYALNVQAIQLTPVNKFTLSFGPISYAIAIKAINLVPSGIGNNPAMPVVVGLSFLNATAVLSAAGFDTSPPIFVKISQGSPFSIRGTVISQSIPAGQAVLPGTKVVLTVNGGGPFPAADQNAVIPWYYFLQR